ncbi:unnamed protein product (mitochondrion) [Plasmodiophora brassicae]|uniref:FMP27/BLTP2/Hobbit GFWDK motif-containing RBG unit domain-containing protein n=1 Tax=Plasmodiophora brassicae TaxID=37360 RepID=A0A3P3Y6P1_PLABS|nr:unnamed protein product [Plasmodiophora brassicae]
MLGDALAVVATLLLLVFGFIYVLLPRLLTTFLNGVSRDVGAFHVAVSLRSQIRIRLIAERLVCIDFNNVIIDVTKRSIAYDDIRANDDVAHADTDPHARSATALHELIAGIVCVRLLSVAVVVHHGSSSATIDVAAFSIMGAPQTRSVWRAFLLASGARVDLRRGIESGLAVNADTIGLELDVDLASRSREPSRVGVHLSGVGCRASFDRVALIESAINELRPDRPSTALFAKPSASRGPQLMPKFRIHAGSFSVDIGDVADSNVANRLRLCWERFDVRLDAQEVVLPGEPVPVRCIATGVSISNTYLEIVGSQRFLSLSTATAEWGHPIDGSVLPACDDGRISLSGLTLCIAPDRGLLAWVVAALARKPATAVGAPSPRQPDRSLFMRPLRLKLTAIGSVIDVVDAFRSSIGRCVLDVDNVVVFDGTTSRQIECRITSVRSALTTPRSGNLLIDVACRGDPNAIMLLDDCRVVAKFASNPALHRTAVVTLNRLSAHVPDQLLDRLVELRHDFAPLVNATPSGPQTRPATWKTSASVTLADVDLVASTFDSSADLLRSVTSAVNSCQVRLDNGIADVAIDDIDVHSFATLSHDVNEFAYSRSRACPDDRIRAIGFSFRTDNPKVRVRHLDLSWSIPFHTSIMVLQRELVSRLSKLTQTSKTNAASSGPRPLSVVFEQISLLAQFNNTTAIALDADEFTAERSVDRDDGSDSVEVTTKPGVVAVNGYELLTFDSSRLSRLSTTSSELPDYDAEFSNLTMTVADRLALGRVIEVIRRKWKALKKWSRSAARETRGPAGLDFRCMCLKADVFEIAFEENQFERLYSMRRWIALETSGRRAHRKLVERFLGHRHQGAGVARDSSRSASHHRLSRSAVSRSRSRSRSPGRPPFDLLDSIIQERMNPDPLDDPFVDRFDQLKFLSGEPSVTTLGCIKTNNFCFTLSPDDSVSSLQEIAAKLASLDSATTQPFSVSDIENSFADLWARTIRFSTTDLAVLLRDYPIPLMCAKRFSLKGLLIVACLSSPQLFTLPRLVFVPLSGNGRTFVPVDLPGGSSIPNKAYVNWRIDCVGFELSYGVCQRGAISALSKAVAKLTDTGSGPSSNVGGALAWWDNLRYKIHGRIRFNATRSSFRLLSSASPYDVEYVELHADQVSIVSVKRRFSCDFKDLQVDLVDGGGTSSTADEPDGLIRPGLLLAAPRLHAIVILRWQCRSADSSQHYVHHSHWDTPGYEFSSLTDRDLFDGFRATAVSFKVHIDATPERPADGSAASDWIIGPFIAFWFNNLPWFRAINTLFSYPPIVVKVQPKTILPNGRVRSAVASEAAFSSLFKKLNLQITLESTIMELIALPRSYQSSSDNDILGAQGFVQTFQLLAELNVEPKSPRGSDGDATQSTGTRLWKWSRQAVSVAYPAIELLVPVVVSSGDPESAVEERLAHPMSQTPFATGEGETGPAFFVSADSLEYTSPSARGRSPPPSVTALQPGHSSLVSPAWSEPPPSMTTSPKVPVNEAEPPATAPTVAADDRHSVRQFLLEHFGDAEMSCLVSDESVIHLENVVEDSEFDTEFTFGDFQEPPIQHDPGNHEHYVLLSGARILWNNTIRSSFNSWWTYMSSFGHTRHDDDIVAESMPPDAEDDDDAEKSSKSGIRHYATWSGSNPTERLTDGSDMTVATLPPKRLSSPQRVTSFEMFRQLDLRGNKSPGETASVNPPAADVVPDTAPEVVHTRFVMRLEKPQIILQSLEVGCSVVVSAHEAKVDVIAYPFTFPQVQDAPSPLSPVDEQQSPPTDARFVLNRKLSSYFARKKVASRNTSPAVLTPRHGTPAALHVDIAPTPDFLYFKKTIRSRLDHAQLHVLASDVDVDANALEWIPLDQFPKITSGDRQNHNDSDDEETLTADEYREQYFKSNGIFQQITRPTSLVFDYSYDVNMDTKDPIALTYQFLHRATAGEVPHNTNEELVDDEDSATASKFNFGADSTFSAAKLPMLSSASHFYIHNVHLVMDSVQYKVLIGVIDKLVLSPVQRVWAEARRVEARRKTQIAGMPSNAIHELQIAKVISEALLAGLYQDMSAGFRRCISYEVRRATWTMITKSPDVFLHVQLSSLKGLHRYGFGEGRDLEVGVKEFRVRNLAPNAPWPDVLVPHSRWEMAKDSLELMVRVRAQVIGFPANVSKKLVDVTTWDHFEVKVFPLIIKVHAQHYAWMRDYFFPSADPAVKRAGADPKSLLAKDFNVDDSVSSTPGPSVASSYSSAQQKAVMRPRRPAMILHSARNGGPRGKDLSRHSTDASVFDFRQAPSNDPASSAALGQDPSPAQPVTQNYFKYLHIGELEFFISFRGSFFDLDDLNVVIDAFSCNHELWTWDKLVGKIESHVQSSVLKQSRSLIKQKFSSSVKSLAEKEHKMRDRFTAKFGLNRPKPSDASGNDPQQQPPRSSNE